HSNERPGVTATFGTSVPLSGLSGAIRRYAFKYSESSYGHWLPLLMADRVNVIEGILKDISRGHIPNIFAEKGWKAEWKHNPLGLLKNSDAVAGTTGGIIAIINVKSQGRKKKRNQFRKSIL